VRIIASCDVDLRTRMQEYQEELRVAAKAKGERVRHGA